MTRPSDAQTIVFFDGVCHLCNGFVDFLMKRDHEKILRFASLQGETAKKLLKPEDLLDLQSVIVWMNGIKVSRSTAILKILWDLGGFWKFLAVIGSWVPLFIRDSLYDFIARNRFRFFKERSVCRRPTQEERAQMLD